ncbi:hypothetical protein ABRQ07_05485 [Pectobacterium polonicum]|uniref:Uncharacterized protein n=1 Tax=Pectobacterium polonicum TaxID=2485124 RepID=A0ABV1P7D1_9GAMM
MWDVFFLIQCGAANQRTFEKRSYTDAFHAQIVHGIFDYCGAPVMTSKMLLMPESGTPEACIDAVRHIGENVFR